MKLIRLKLGARAEQVLYPGLNSLLGLLGFFRLLRLFSLLRFLSHDILFQV